MKKIKRGGLCNRKVFRSLLTLSNYIDNIEKLLEQIKDKDIVNSQKNSLKLDNKELKERLLDLGRENLKIVYGFAKVIGLTTATIVLLNMILEVQPIFDLSILKNCNVKVICQSIWEWHINTSNSTSKELIIKHQNFDIKILLWLTSCMVLILTYDAAMFATIFIHRIIDKIETLLMFSFVGFEFFLFAILYPNFFTEKDNLKNVVEHSIGYIPVPHFAAFWFIIYGLYTLSVCLLTYRTIKKIDNTDFENEEMRKVARDIYMTDSRETRPIGILHILFGIWLLSVDTTKWYYNTWVFIAAVVSLGIILWGFSQQHKKRSPAIEILFRKQI